MKGDRAVDVARLHDVAVDPCLAGDGVEDFSDLPPGVGDPYPERFGQGRVQPRLRDDVLSGLISCLAIAARSPLERTVGCVGTLEETARERE